VVCFKKLDKVEWIVISILRDYLERLEVLHNEIWRAIAGLPQEALDWVPGPGMNSLGVLVVHLAGAERYWIGDVAGEDRSGRVRKAEFQTHGLGVEALASLLTETLIHSRNVLAKLTTADLDAQRHSVRDGETYTVAWCLAHALEHTGLHLGHIQVTRQLWDQRAAEKK
jgi:uncharacterized damage-inducible protein DinB